MTRDIVSLRRRSSDCSDALLGDVEPGVPIARYLRCSRSGWDFVLHARTPAPLIVNVDRFACYSDEGLPLLLQAVTRLLQRSHALRTHPTRKAAFWAHVFPQHNQSRDLQLGVERWMMEHDAFPRVVLSFHQMQITTPRLDALLAFLTSSETAAECNTVCPSSLSIGLRFTQCAAFNTESLQLLRTFLDALFAHPQRRFAIRSLDLSHNQMSAEQLELLRALLDRNARVYGIAHVALNDIVFTRVRESAEADALTALLRSTVCVSRDSCNVVQPVQHMSFDHTSLQLQHFVAMCSAWRYGCAVEELSLLSTLNRVSAADRQHCWRWLAFALFYPRSRRAASAFALTRLDVSRIELRVADAKALRLTLQEPARELLLYNTRSETDVATTYAQPHMRGFERGARFFEHADATSQRVETLASTCELEVLATTADDGWVCVVLAGVGLGWTAARHVLPLANSDSVDSAYESESDHLYELTAHRLSSKRTPITTLIECVGHRLRLLSLKYNTVDVAAIQAHCPRLEHLDLEGCHLPLGSLRALLGASADFVQQLKSLNMSDMPVADDDVCALCDVLMTPHTQLRELQLVTDVMRAPVLARISQMLAANRTLEVLELPMPNSDVVDDDADSAAALTALARVRRHADELLTIEHSPSVTTALLSVLFHASAVGRGAPRSRLDADSIAVILAFAGTPVRRRILWRGPVVDGF